MPPLHRASLFAATALGSPVVRPMKMNNNIAAGKLIGNQIPWRDDSELNDGKEAKLDLSNGDSAHMVDAQVWESDDRHTSFEQLVVLLLDNKNAKRSNIFWR